MKSITEPHFLFLRPEATKLFVQNSAIGKLDLFNRIRKSRSREDIVLDVGAAEDMPVRRWIFLFYWLTCSYSAVDDREITALSNAVNSDEIALFDGGDVVGGYRLEQRLDYLGSTTNRFHSDLRGQKLLIAPDGRISDPTGFESQQSTAFGYLTLAGEIRMNINASCIRNGTYCLDQHIFRGGHGEVWRARRVMPGGLVDQNHSFILKRMHIKGRPDILKCALREIFFGVKFNAVSNVARYVTYFNTDDDYW